MNKDSIIPFRLFLPVAELIVSAVFVWPYAGFLYFQLHSAKFPTAQPGVEQPQLQPNITVPLSPSEERAVRAMETRLSVPALLNFPCMFLGLASNAAVPKAMLPILWRAISWPVIGIVFWWVGGRSIDALRASRRRVLTPRITFAELLLGLYVVGFCCFFLCFGFILDPSIQDEVIYPWHRVVAACVLWVILGASIVTARVVQRRIQRSSPDDHVSRVLSS